MGWLSGWRYRRAVEVVEKSGSDLTDFQVRIELNSSNFDFSKANADGSDIRFTTDDGETLIPHWIESWDGSNQVAVVWVKVPYIPANGTATIYMYYGNPSAASESDGEGVFEFFDDFKEDTGRWTLIGANSAKSYEIADSILHLPRLSSNVSGLDEAVYTATGDLTQVTVEAKMKISKSVEPGLTGLYFFKSIDTGAHALVFGATDKGNFGVSDWNFDGSGVTELYGFAHEYNEYHIWTVKKNGNNYTLIYDGEEKTTITRSTTPLNYLGFGVPYSRNELWVDWVRVRKYAEQEPIVQVGDEETSWLYGWSYRRAITITDQSGSDLTDFQVKITLDASNFDAWDKVNADGSDLRFTDSDGTTLLPYWIESFDAVNKQAIVWVKVPSIPANGTATIYMYYGNNEAADASDGDATFEFFDDFNDLSKWNTDTGSPGVNNGILSLPAETIIRSTDTVDMNNKVVEGLVKLDSNYRFGFSFSERFIIYDVPDSKYGEWQLHAGDGSKLAYFNGIDPSTNVWQLWRVVYSSSQISIYLDDTHVGDFSDTYRTTSGLYLRHWTSGTTLVDWVRVRKYAEQEPSVSVSTTEESAVVNVSGVVQLPDGTPVGGVWVVAVRQVDNKIDAATISNQDGSFTLTVLKYKKYSIIAYPPNDTTKNGDIKAHIQT